jgi:cell division septum initiation protein DivIVA
MKPHATGTPEFTIAIRGYDKLQVDEYVTHLQEAVDEAEDRARAAESELEVTRHTTVGPRIGEIFELAVTEAKDLQYRARTECEEKIAEGREKANKIVAESREREAESREKIGREKEEARREAQAARKRADLEIDQLNQTKAALFDELTRLQDVLATATGIVAAEPVEDGGAADTIEMPRERRPRSLPEAAAS